jgi:hypothetical protein
MRNFASTTMVATMEDSITAAAVRTGISIKRWLICTPTATMREIRHGLASSVVEVTPTDIGGIRTSS